MSFYTDVIRKDARFKSTATIKDMALLEPGMRAAVQELIADAKAAGHDLRVMETFRSQARQAYVFMHGWSHLKNVGCHGYGVACDLGLFDNGVYEEDGEKYRFIVPIAKKHGLVSGIDWGTPFQKHTFMDAGHVQRVPVYRQGELFSGAWYPGEKYNPFDDIKSHYGRVAA